MRLCGNEKGTVLNEFMLHCVSLRVCVRAWHIFLHLAAGFHKQLSIIKMACHCTLAVVVLAFTGGWRLCAADVGDFVPCLQLFYKSWPPKGLDGTPICQHYYNQYRFATLYNRTRRSPWFSAYMYSVPAGKRPSSSWKFEPQVRMFKYNIHIMWIFWFIQISFLILQLLFCMC